MPDALLLLLPIVTCLVAAGLAGPLFRRLGGQAGWWLALAPLAGFVALAAAAPSVLAGGRPEVAWTWVPGLGLDVALRLEPWSLVMALVVTGVGAPLLVYAGAYAADDPRGGRMLTQLAAFAAAMLTLVLADHLLLLYVAWEATSVLSFLLVGHKHELPEARAAARRALVITVAGGLALLAGLLLIAEAAGSWRLGEIVAGGSLADHAFYVPIVLCIALAAATKSAQFPFHLWLPGAMAAPTPVSCYLHAATMVKAGIFLLASLLPVLAGSALWTGLIGGMGAVTAVYGGARAVAQADAKGLVAWSTVSALGLMVALCGLATPYAVTALITVLVAHAAYKATLFMVVGSLDHGTHSRDLGRFGGLARAMPLTFTAAAVAGISLMGLPPTAGFVGKEYLLKAVLGGPWWLTTATLAAALATAGAALVIGLRPFVGRRPESLPAHESSLGFTAPALVLAAAGLVLGPATALLGPGLYEAAASALAPAGKAPPVAKAWPGTDAVLALSLGLAAVGGALGLAWPKARAALARIAWPGGGVVFDRMVDSLLMVARLHTRVIVNGQLRSYVAILITLATGALATGLLLTGPALSPPPAPGHLLDGIALLLCVAGLAGIVLVRDRVGVTIGLGALGAGVALVFVARGAPDLALTQVLVEALTVVLFVLAFRALPRLGPVRGGRAGWWTAGLAAAFGLMVGISLLAVSHNPGVGLTLHELSWDKAYGRNIVNVTLVDFRAFDTLGEIAVLALAAIGLLTVLPAVGLAARQGEVGTANVGSPILRTSARLLLPLFLVMSVFLLLRGHHLPGGGFAGGLVAAAGIAFAGFVHGRPALPSLLGLDHRSLLGAGLLVALVSALLPVAGGHDFFTGLWAEIHLLPRAPVKLGTPLLFDIGVYLLVIGVGCAFVDGLLDRLRHLPSGATA